MRIAPRAAALLVTALLALTPWASGSERSVSAAEATGTWRLHESEIEILALGQGKLRVQFDLVYSYNSPSGPSANIGSAVGEAEIVNDIATFVVPDSDGACTITLTFATGGRLQVAQEGGIECGFGHNVRADGTYRKISNRKPQFDETSRRDSPRLQATKAALVWSTCVTSSAS